MDRHVDSLEPGELLRFFHLKKTELSCMENPMTFLRQLRDHDLIPEDGYKKANRESEKEKLKKCVYENLNWLERRRSERIRLFWKCVSEDAIVDQYQTLRDLRRRLVDGSFRENIRLYEKVEKKTTKGNKRKEDSDEDLESVKKQLRDAGDSGDAELTPGQKKEEVRNRRRHMFCDDEEEPPPGPSSQLGTADKEASSSAVKNSNVTVTCGDLQGLLSKRQLARGERCIRFDEQWLTPTEFERRAGKQRQKNWKLSIRCDGVSLATLIQDGRLAAASFKRAKAEKSSFPPEEPITDSEDGNESEECDDEADRTSSDTDDSAVDTEQEQQQEGDGGRTTFTVTCGAVTATLHKKRFASGSCGKSVRTETSWMTPEEFVREASRRPDACWRKDITCDGKALGLLINENVLRIHSLLCPCGLCRLKDQDLENQRNDDECCLCRSDLGPEDLVVCDRCPRSFHPTCHLPHVDAATLSDDGPWTCTFCEVAALDAGPELDRRAAKSQPLPGHMLKCQYLLLRLGSADAERTPSSSTSQGAPKWFNVAAKKLQRLQFQTVGDFVSDLQLVLSQDVRRAPLKELFEREFKKVFKIRT